MSILLALLFIQLYQTECRLAYRSFKCIVHHVVKL